MNSSQKNLRPFIASSLLVAFCALTLSQLSFVYAQVDSDSPITSPLSAPITSYESPTPSEEPSVAPSVEPSSEPSVEPNPSVEPSVEPSSAPSSNSNSNNNSVSAPSAPSCNDSKPTSAPVITAWKTVGPNQVKISWTKAGDPVTYYLLSYGVKPGQYLYGNPNIGDKNTTSFTVNGLSRGVTYYFRVRAGNNCAPGAFSNEVAINSYGQSFTQPAQGFKPGVLSAHQTSSNSNKMSNNNQPKINPVYVNNQPKPHNFISQVFGFFSKFNPFH